MKRLTFWSIVGSLWTVFYIMIVVIVTIPDYPRTGKLFEQICLDNSGYFHELWYITIGYLVGMFMIMLTSFWYTLTLFLQELKGFGMLPDGRIIFIRKKKN